MLDATTIDLVFAEAKSSSLSELDDALELEQIDKEMIPFLNRLNALPFVMTRECCAGHVRYATQPDGTPSTPGFLQSLENSDVDIAKGRWGYLLLHVTEEVWHEVIGEMRDGPLSDLIYKQGVEALSTFGIKTMMQEIVPIEDDDGICVIGAAWDSSQQREFCEKLCVIFESL